MEAEFRKGYYNIIAYSIFLNLQYAIKASIALIVTTASIILLDPYAWLQKANGGSGGLFLGGWVYVDSIMENSLYSGLGGYANLVLKLTLAQLAAAGLIIWIYYTLKGYTVLEGAAGIVNAERGRGLIIIGSRLALASSLLVAAGAMLLATLNPLLAIEVAVAGFITYLAMAAAALASGASSLSKLGSQPRVEGLLGATGLGLNAATLVAMGIPNPVGLALQSLGFYLIARGLLARCTDVCGPAAIAEAAGVTEGRNPRL
ncbi:hypothetical protein [Aeropyrum pernix]|uniref:hypothetical protein n=1 Tax=Aeropyrum pernix TaxID=56636 RepID=UPI00103798B5|nr:hypothetical protein [Aeropyrum pernix]